MFKKESTKIKLKDIKPSIKKIRWGKKHVGLKEKIIKSYNGGIVISNDNKILDGNHRYYILLEEFGPEYVIDVEQTDYSLTTWVLLMVIFSPIIVCIILVMSPIILINKVHKLLK